jgi:DNA polymerase-3 subunit epsilon
MFWFWLIVGFFAVWVMARFCHAATKKTVKGQVRGLLATEGQTPQGEPWCSVDNAAKTDAPKIALRDDQEDESIQKGNSIVGVYEDYVVVDVETTGGSPKKDTIIEVAAVRIESGEVAKKYDTLINPNRPISGRITKINGISDDMVLSAPNIDDVMPQLLEFIGDSIVVAHNANFDIGFISCAAHDVTGKWFTNDFIDTLKLSRTLFSEQKGHKLEDIIRRFGIEDTVEHRALSDAINVYRVYECIKEHIKEFSIDTNNITANKQQKYVEPNIVIRERQRPSESNLKDDEKAFFVGLAELCGDNGDDIRVDVLGGGEINVYHRDGLFLGKIKMGSRVKWISGAGIGDGSVSQRFVGDITEIIKKAKKWVTYINKVEREKTKWEA